MCTSLRPAAHVPHGRHKRPREVGHGCHRWCAWSILRRPKCRLLKRVGAGVRHVPHEHFLSNCPDTLPHSSPHSSPPLLTCTHSSTSLPTSCKWLSGRRDGPSQMDLQPRVIWLLPRTWSCLTDTRFLPSPLPSPGWHPNAPFSLGDLAYSTAEMKTQLPAPKLFVAAV